MVIGGYEMRYLSAKITQSCNNPRSTMPSNASLILVDQITNENFSFKPNVKSQLIEYNTKGTSNKVTM